MLTQVDIQKLPSYQLGMEQGLEKGREEGLEKGMEKGRKEVKLQVARNLLDKLPDNEVAQTTGLSLQEIRGLRKAP
ncbi:MAG: hypothetical protein GY807_04655 [Gammaproteobacteria bacterium]|nr:hypothetical protein [Gammaproteobacteria bacterium]